MFRCDYISACALVSVTGGPFDVYDVTSNTYNVFPPLVVIFDYRLRENMKGEANNTEGGGRRVEGYNILYNILAESTLKIGFRQKTQYCNIHFKLSKSDHY